MIRNPLSNNMGLCPNLSRSMPPTMPAMSIGDRERRQDRKPPSWMPMFSAVWANVDTYIMAQTRPKMEQHHGQVQREGRRL